MAELLERVSGDCRKDGWWWQSEVCKYSLPPNYHHRLSKSVTPRSRKGILSHFSFPCIIFS